MIDERAYLLRRDLIRIGRNVRIDAFAVLSPGEDGIEIGDDVHIGVGVRLFGSGGRIVIGDGASLSPGATVFTACDDFTDGSLVGPQHPNHLRHVTSGAVKIGRQAALGCNSVVLPGCDIAPWAILGACSLLKCAVPSRAIFAGVPARLVGWRGTSTLA
jgi:galactoside O-acetyltransferase